VHNDIIRFDDVSVYQYGLEVLMMSLAKFVGIAILSLLTGYFFESLIFVIGFSTIRSYAGGYHASSVSRCFLLTVFFIGFDIWLSNFIVSTNVPWLSIAIAGVACWIIYLYSPVEVISRPISDQERHKFRSYSIKLSLLYLGVVSILTTMNTNRWYLTIFSVAMLIEAITLIIELKRKEIVG